MAIRETEGKQATVRFNTRLCIHARRCAMGSPAAFDPSRSDWIDPDAVDVETLTRVVLNCPSGALTIERKDGGIGDVAPATNQVTLSENGPLVVHADMEIEGSGPALRATLCRCGLSKRKPFCDGAHAKEGFVASGEAEGRDSELATGELTGKVKVTPHPNGPLQFKGNLEIAGGSGAMIGRVKGAFLCRCGQSKNKPYCDGSHKEAGFEAEGV